MRSLESWHELANNIGEFPFVAVNVTCNRTDSGETPEEKFTRNEGYRVNNFTGWWKVPHQLLESPAGRKIVLFLANPNQRPKRDVYIGTVSGLIADPADDDQRPRYAIHVEGHWNHVGECVKSFSSFFDGIENLGAQPVVVWISQENVAPAAADEFRARFDPRSITVEFNPSSLEDGRRKIYTQIVQRQGQSRFRESLLQAYQEQCAFSGCKSTFVLEAAHILPYFGPETNHVTNGLLLRADLHTLFDLNLVAIDPSTNCVHIAEELKATEYAKLHGVKVVIPESTADRPNAEALQMRWRERSR